MEDKVSLFCKKPRVEMREDVGALSLEVPLSYGTLKIGINLMAAPFNSWENGDKISKSREMREELQKAFSLPVLVKTKKGARHGTVQVPELIAEAIINKLENTL